MYKYSVDRDESRRLAYMILSHRIFRKYRIEDRYNYRCYNKIVVGCDGLIGTKLNLTIFNDHYKNVVRLDPRYIPGSHGNNLLPEYLEYSSIDDWSYNDIENVVKCIIKGARSCA